MKKIIAAMALATVAAVVLVAIAVAGQSGPLAGGSTANSLTWVDGNPRCPGDATGGGFKVEPVANGMYDINGKLTTDPTKGVIVISNFNGKTLDWAFTAYGRATYEIAYVIVKGGSEANLYAYSDALDNSDAGLHTPLNPNGNTFGGTKVYGFSHVDFCFDPKA